MLFAFLPTLFPFLVKEKQVLTVDTVLQQQLDALAVKTNQSQTAGEINSDAEFYAPKESHFEKYRREKFSGTLFYFDPNKATAEEWKRLGVREKTIGTILNYRSKGGRFYKPDDLRRIYGLRPHEVERLLPFVAIEQKDQQRYKESEIKQPAFTNSRKEFATVAIDINSADTSAWKQLKGIGSGYAKRIVNFRTKLGGFVSVEQVAETYGLPDSVFQQIKTQLKTNTSMLRKININNCAADELKAHPYIGYSVANAIVQYRKEHGLFTSVADLQKIGAIDEKLYRKISPYLRIEGEK